MSQPAERVRRRYVVHGRVQGVGYRMFAQARAEAHGVRGWVRNRPDGRSVELTVEAPPEALAAFERDLERGPGGAYVSKLERLEPSDNESYATFEIRWWGA